MKELVSSEVLSTCPHCRSPRRDSRHHFCTQCGLALSQPCPHCSNSLETPSAPFAGCPSCQHNFWSCQACGRLYHLDKTSCTNGYCPERGRFWTTRFGSGKYLQTPSERHLFDVSCGESNLRPAWIGGITEGSDLRWPSLHSHGLLLSVQDSGVVELWAERGAPVPAEESEFGEKSVCLTRLDLGEPCPAPPFAWNGHFYIPGERSLTPFEFSSSPSLGRRIPLDELGTPKHFASIGAELLIWGESGVGRLAPDGFLEVLDEEFKADQESLMIAGESDVLLISQLPSPKAWLFHLGGEVEEVDVSRLPADIEYGLHASGYLLLGGNTLSFLEAGAFHTVELPSLVVTAPIYDCREERLTLLLSDGSARTCSTRGDKFSFLCDLGGPPSTVPLRLQGDLFYGIEGRYICRQGEPIRPRLPMAPMGALSYANGRLFGTSRDGSMFCFELPKLPPHRP